MNQTKDPVPDLATVKATLSKFAASRGHHERATLERDFGALLLYLIRLAGTLEIDLIGAGEQSIERAAATRPRLLSRERPAG